MDEHEKCGRATNSGQDQDHINIQQAVTTFRVFIEQHDPLDPKDNGASISTNENPAKNGQKTPEEIAAEVRAKGEK